MRQIFLDLDGVLADFDAASIALFGKHPRRAEQVLGTPEFWRHIQLAGSFYRGLALTSDAMKLYRAVAHLSPIILTGVPAGGWAEEQKIAWVEQHFPGVKVITCRAREKFLYMRHPGDVLVDDYLKYKELWEQAGGVFIHHTSVRSTIQKLARLGFDLHPGP